ncbi:LuxR C-terminal-related transcriptional regulator [Streptomyces canus]|uniref:LuxR C-terminal-related transcriptional regulator n=1 Tax=Streptomyces sp. SAI-144 TaxID=2940544 RepID=UPI00247469CB|nr:LuxR C-terminal-related transcriptional regulator [Streptomyces sp. SAI-144]MDH6435677.1 DNA-binding CsgD family transcriptional regulator [Streptomyces sp. SAI-144]
MSDRGSNAYAFVELDDTSAVAYGLAVELGSYTCEKVAERLGVGLSEAERAQAVLRRLSLLQPMPGDPGVLVPVGPDVAAADLVSSAEREIRDLQQAVTDVRTKLLSLTPTYFEGRRKRNRLESFDVISDADMVQSLIDEVGSRSVKELLSVQPGGPRPAHLLLEARTQTLGQLRRGMRVQTIYQHTARSDPATRSYVEEVTAAGAEIRTTDQVVDRMLIFDGEVAFLPAGGDRGGRTSGAVVVREPTLLAFMRSVFAYQWDGATPFEVDAGFDARKGDTVSDDLTQSILRLMAKGYKDEMVARKLGMSVRTCRRHIAGITEELEATSRFQAGFNAARSGMLTEHDPGAGGSHSSPTS